MKNLLHLFIILTFCQLSFGQSNVYLLYNQLPLTVNPSLTGSACGPRASVYYQQLSNEFIESLNFNSKGLNFDIPIKLKNNDKIGLGYKLVQDVAGESKFTNFGNYLSVAYHKSLSKNQNKPQYLSIGMEAGISNTSLDGRGFRWPSQITPGGFDPTLPGEDIDYSILYFDLNLGIAWSGHISEKIKSTAGIAINHLNTPNVSFLGASDVNLAQRFVAHISLDIALNDKWSILPSAYYTSQNQQNYYICSANIGHQLNNKTNIQLGGGYAKNNQPFINANINFNRLNLGLAYGFENIAGLDKMEVVLGYAFGNYSCKQGRLSSI